MNEYTNIKNFKFWCNKVLPLVYDDSLSYYEVLCKVVDYLNTCIDNVNYLNEIYGPVTSAVNELTERFNTLKSTVEASILLLNERCTALEDADERNFNALKTYIDNIETGLNIRVRTLEAEYNTLVALYQSFKSYSDSGDVITLQNAKRYTDNKVKDILKYIEDPKIWFVVDPLDNQVKDIQTVINNLFNLIRWGSFTCLEFDGSGYTCEYIDSIGFSAEDFDYYGRFRFLFNIHYVTPEDLEQYAKIDLLENYALKTDLDKFALKADLVIYNPVTGYRNTIQQVVNTLISLHANGNNCVTLDGLDYTATEYDALQISAFTFDFEGIIKTEGYYISPVSGIRSPLQQILNQLAALSANGVTADVFDALMLTAQDFDDAEYTAYHFDFEGI